MARYAMGWDGMGFINECSAFACLLFICSDGERMSDEYHNGGDGSKSQLLR
jgi:hypothetical protein